MNICPSCKNYEFSVQEKYRSIGKSVNCPDCGSQVATPRFWSIYTAAFPGFIASMIGTLLIPMLAFIYFWEKIQTLGLVKFSVYLLFILFMLFFTHYILVLLDVRFSKVRIFSEEEFQRVSNSHGAVALVLFCFVIIPVVIYVCRKSF